MARQINFYSWPGEVHQLQDWLISQGVLFVKQPIHSTERFFDTVNSAPDKDQEWSKIYLTQEAFLKNIFFSYNEFRKHYFLEERQSWALEFSRPDSSIKYGISRCRFFYDTSYYDEKGLFVHKDEVFLKWAEKLVKRFKKEFLVKFKTPQADYATRGFIKEYNESVKLSL